MFTVLYRVLVIKVTSSKHFRKSIHEHGHTSSTALKLQIRKSVLLLDFKSNLRMDFNLGFILAINATFLRADPGFVLQIYRLMPDVNCLHFNIRKT